MNDLELSSDAEKFAKTEGLRDSCDFLLHHQQILNQKCSDGILAEAFSLQMAGKEKEARLRVRQSLIIKYCGQLGHDGVRLFFERYLFGGLTQNYQQGTSRGTFFSSGCGGYLQTHT